MKKERGDCTVVIPARYASKRFPGKVLARLGGRSVVEWCYRAARAARVGPVIVATDDRRVVSEVESFGGKVVLAAQRAASGTDRVYNAIKKIGSKTPDIINLQGDEPLISPDVIKKVAQLLRREPRADIATAVTPLSDPRRLKSTDVVKAAVARDGQALYFSRSPIPARAAGVTGKIPWFEHRGIYGFRRKALERFVRLKPSRLEKTERLEQLRALEDGMRIFAVQVRGHAVAIDRVGDLRRAARCLKSVKGARS